MTKEDYNRIVKESGNNTEILHRYSNEMANEKGRYNLVMPFDVFFKYLSTWLLNMYPETFWSSNGDINKSTAMGADKVVEQLNNKYK
jgi:hypothetical protein